MAKPLRGLLRGVIVALFGYGLLIGKIVGSRVKRPGTPHWLLMVQPGDAQHPPYRVAVNLQETRDRKQPAELQYQIVKFGGKARSAQAGNALVKKLLKLGLTPNFTTADSDPSLPTLDFVRDGVIDPEKFKDLQAGDRSLQREFAKAVKAAQQSEIPVAVFGTGYPIDPNVNRSVPTGFTGVENIHMNQGALNRINSKPHYLENGPDQDGGIIFLFPTAAEGFFVKFEPQTTSTDEDGHPTITQIPKIDGTSAAVRKAIMPPFPRPRSSAAALRRDAQTSAKHKARSVPAARRRATSPSAAPASNTNPPATPNPKGFVFADFNPGDTSGQYIPDIDTDTYKTPFVQKQGKGQTRGIVPTPRAYPRMDLSSVVGSDPPGYVSDRTGTSIAFDVIGDSGAPSQRQLEEYEVKVTDLLANDAAQSPPAFMFHVGDVVYFYGEENYYYSQFYEPFHAYPAPIFAIPGNHDGVTYNANMTSLNSFRQAFCADQPSRWPGAGGILRTTMTQPGVYFTLDAPPLVSIIGLYSNCGKSLGWLNDAQLMFLYQELVRLKALRKNGLPAVILAIHHCPRWFPGAKDPNSTAIDATCKKAGFWPDAVLCGHAHLYQRIVRQDTGQDIPYIVTGAGGYAVTPRQEIGKPYMAQLMKNGTRLANHIYKSGYVRATLTSPANGDPTLRFDYRSVKPKSSGPDDTCTVNLRTNKLV